MKTLVTAVSLLCISLFAGGAGGLDRTALAKPGTPTGSAASKQAAARQQAAPATDAAINAAVKDKLSKTPSLKDANINSATKDGVVTLTGTLKTGGLKGVATNVAKSVKGVKKVDNQITVEPKAASKTSAHSKT